LTPFIGRKRELEHLSECSSRVKEVQGQVVGVVGEAEVGKSRLLLEFTKRPTLEIQCLHLVS